MADARELTLTLQSCLLCICACDSVGSLEADYAEDFRWRTREGSAQNAGLWAGYSGVRVCRKVDELKGLSVSAL